MLLRSSTAWSARAGVPRLTESAFRRLDVALRSLGIYYYEVVPAWSGNAGVPRLTESAFRRLEVALRSPGIYYYEVAPAWSAGAGVPRFGRSRGGCFRHFRFFFGLFSFVFLDVFLFVFWSFWGAILEPFWVPSWSKIGLRSVQDGCRNDIFVKKRYFTKSFQNQ